MAKEGYKWKVRLSPDQYRFHYHSINPKCEIPRWHIDLAPKISDWLSENGIRYKTECLVATGMARICFLRKSDAMWFKLTWYQEL